MSRKFEQSDIMKNEIQTKLNAAEKSIVDSYNARSNKCKEYCNKYGLQLHGPPSFLTLGTNSKKTDIGLCLLKRIHGMTKVMMKD